MRDASLEDRARAVIGRIERLPTPSVVAVRLLQATESTETAVRDVVGIVSQDPAMAARVLSLCRRCHRGLSVEVDSIERAVVLLGFDELRAAALSVELTGLLGEAGVEGVGARLRRRAVVVASLARLAADRVPMLDDIEPAAAFLAGLLHDLGHLALHAAIPEALERIADSATLGDTDFDATLRRVVGVDGPMAGEQVASRWGLPSALRRTIGPSGHDDGVTRGVAQRLEKLIALADVVTRRHGIGVIGRRPSEGSARELETALGLSPDALDGVLPEAVELAGRSADLLGLNREPSEAMLVRTLSEANAELDRMRRRFVAASAVGERRRASSAAPFLDAVDATEGLAAVQAAIVADIRNRHPEARVGIAWRAFDRWQAVDHVGTPAIPLREPGVWLREQVAQMTSATDGAACRVVGGEGDELLIVIAPAIEIPPDVATAWRSLFMAARRIEELQSVADTTAMVRADEIDRLRTEARRTADSAVAEIVAGAAHEMNNPLTVISGRAQLLRGRSADPLIEDAIEEIVDAGRRLAGIVSGLHRHAVAVDLRATEIESSALVEQAAAAAQRLVRGLGPVDVADDAGPVRLCVDVRRIVEVVVEACRNALEAHEGARIRLRTSSDAVDGRWSLQVEDDGPGFGREALDHAFEPFFSLKPAGRRAGLGLAVVKRVVEAHGGTVAVRNLPDGGGCLMATFPIRTRETGRVAA